MPGPPDPPDSVTNVGSSLVEVRQRLANLDLWVDQVMQRAAAGPLEGIVSLEAVPVQPLPELLARVQSQSRFPIP